VNQVRVTRARLRDGDTIALATGGAIPLGGKIKLQSVVCSYRFTSRPHETDPRTKKNPPEMGRAQPHTRCVHPPAEDSRDSRSALHTQQSTTVAPPKHQPPVSANTIHHEQGHHPAAPRANPARRDASLAANGSAAAGVRGGWGQREEGTGGGRAERWEGAGGAGGAAGGILGDGSMAGRAIPVQGVMAREIGLVGCGPNGGGPRKGPMVRPPDHNLRRRCVSLSPCFARTGVPRP